MPARVVGHLTPPPAGRERVLARFPRRRREEIRVAWVDGPGRPVLEVRRHTRRGDGWSPMAEAFTFTPGELGGLLGAVAAAHGAALAARRASRHPKERP